VIAVIEPGETSGVLDISDGKHSCMKHTIAVNGSMALSSTDYDKVKQLLNVKHPDN
jgi:hypothetical protein